jgi:hypothetical protein
MLPSGADVTAINISKGYTAQTNCRPDSLYQLALECPYACGEIGSTHLGKRTWAAHPIIFLRHQRLCWRIAVTSGGDSGQDSKSHHANDAHANPSCRNMEQMGRERQPHHKNDVSDYVQAKRHVSISFLCGLERT